MKNYLLNPAHRQKLKLLLYDSMVVLGVFLISYVLRVMFYEGGHFTELWGRVSWLVLLGVLLHLVCFFIFGLYETEVNTKRKLLFINVLLSIIAASVGVAILSFLFPMYQIGRVLIGTHFLVMVFAVYLWRVVYGLGTQKGDVKKVLIVGWNSVSSKIIQALSVTDVYTIDSLVIEKGADRPDTVGNPVPVHDSIESALETSKPDILVFAKTPTSLHSIRNLLLNIKFEGVEILSGIQFYERVAGKVPVAHIHEKWLLMSGSESAFQPAIYPHLKRLLDVTVSILVLFLSSPLLLLIGLLIRMDSKGPILFRQERVGQHERPFMLLKFRTMIDDAEKQTGPRWASEADPRITRIGKVLRKTHLDEFPQFINVLRGNMSLVGPRPFRKVFTDMLAEKFPYYRLRFKVKPGLSGWAQVNMSKGNTDEGQYEKLEYEIYYIYHQSIFLDLFIILKTVQTVIFRPGE